MILGGLFGTDIRRDLLDVDNFAKGILRPDDFAGVTVQHLDSIGGHRSALNGVVVRDDDRQCAPKGAIDGGDRIPDLPAGAAQRREGVVGEQRISGERPDPFAAPTRSRLVSHLNRLDCEGLDVDI